MIQPPEANCIEIIRPYIDAVAQEGMPPVQLLGGVGSVALTDERTVIKADEQRIIAPAGLHLSNYRDDGNVRDVESLVLSNRAEDVRAVEECGEQTMGDMLIVEVFPFLDDTRTEKLLAAPFGKRALATFVSDRYMPAETVWTPGEATAKRVLFPFAVPIADEALETWTLEIDDAFEIPVPSPGAVVINYLTRSISGLRGKDEDKIERMAQAIFDKSPDMVDWIVDGPGSEQFELARVFHTLRESKRHPQVLTVGGKLDVTALDYYDLLEHPSFLLNELDEGAQLKALRRAAIKSRVLHFGEGLSFIVTPFQKYVEPHISSILHNK
jgi:hypothetical protein